MRIVCRGAARAQPIPFGVCECRTGRTDVKNTHRRVIVLSTLITVLTLTSALLLALAPAPLSADASSSLFAIDAPQTMDKIFDTDSPVRTARWRYIYVHH